MRVKCHCWWLPVHAYGRIAYHRRVHVETCPVRHQIDGR